jgi:hypothetical protein
MFYSHALCSGFVRHLSQKAWQQVFLADQAPGTLTAKSYTFPLLHPFRWKSSPCLTISGASRGMMP